MGAHLLLYGFVDGQYAQGRMSVGKGQAKPFYTRKRPVRCSDAADQPEWEATDVFETGLPGNVTRRGTTVRFLCEERTPSWKTMGPLEDSHHREATN